MKTGFNDLDKVVNLEKGELIIVGARPAMGKSTFVQNILSYIAIEEKKSVAYFNLESSKESIVQKLIISNSMVECSKFAISENNDEKSNLEFTEVEWKKISHSINLLKDVAVYIDDTPNITINDICKKARNLKNNKKIELLVIDYLQLIGFDKNKLLSRNREIEEISKILKILAKELDIPIIVTSQLSREPEKRKDKRPIILDFKESRGILKYTDIVLFIYRDSYYNKKIKNATTEIIIAKNKQGACETVKLEWKEQC